MNNEDLENLRQDYLANSLDVEDVLNNPIDQFKAWFKEAQHAEIKEPNAMILGTSDLTGHVSQRTVLLKGLSEDGFVWYTNYESSKGKVLEENPKASLLFLWLDLQRQIRIEGTVQKTDRASALKYFQSRPRGSQVGAWASPQSKVIDDRELLENRVTAIEEKFKSEEFLPIPPFWGGYCLKPSKMEFWQGRRSRLHDRILYQKNDLNDWYSVRIAP